MTVRIEVSGELMMDPSKATIGGERMAGAPLRARRQNSVRSRFRKVALGEAASSLRVHLRQKPCARIVSAYARRPLSTQGVARRT